MLRKLYKLIGSPVNGAYVRWYNYLWPRRITLKCNPAIYCWLGFNFSWLGDDDGLDSECGV